MRIINCPECSGYGDYDDGSNLRPLECYYCSGTGKMTALEWLLWRYQDSRIAMRIGWWISRHHWNKSDNQRKERER